MVMPGGGNVVDEAVFRLVADTRGFVTSVQSAGKQAAGELKQVDTAAAQNTKSVNTLGQSFGKLVAVIGTMAAAYVGVSTIKSAISYTQEYGLAVAKLTRETGMSTEAASEMIAVGHHMGIGADDLSRSLGILAKKLKGVQDEETGVTTGGKSAGDILKDIGVVATTTDGELRPMAELLPEISAAFMKMPDGVAKTGLAMQLFGRSGKDMIPFLNLGPTAMKELGEEAKKLGVVLGPENVQQIKNYTFAQRDMSEALGGIKLMIGMELMPALTSLMKWFVDVQPKIREFIGAAQDIGENVVSALKPFAEQLGVVAQGLGVVIQALSQSTLGVVAMGTALGALMLRGTIASLLALASGFLTMAEAEGVAEAASLLLADSLGPLVLIAAIIAAAAAFFIIGKVAQQHAEKVKEAKKAVDEYVQSLEDQAGLYAKLAGGDEMQARMDQDIVTYGEYGAALEAVTGKKKALMEEWSAATVAGQWEEGKQLTSQINEIDAGLDTAKGHTEAAKEALQKLAASGQITFQQITAAVAHGNLTLAEAKDIWPDYAKAVDKGATANDRAEVKVTDLTEAFKIQVDKVTKLSDQLKDLDSALERITGQETAEEAALIGHSAALNEVIKGYDARTAAGETLTSEQQAEYDAAVKGKDISDAQIDYLKAQKEAVEKVTEAQEAGRPTAAKVIQDTKDAGVAAGVIAREWQIAIDIENALVTDPLQQQIMRLTEKAGLSADAAKEMARQYGAALNAAVLADQQMGGHGHPPMAEGGWTRQRRVMVGEKGPEIAELPIGTRIYSAKDSRRMTARGLIPGFQEGGIVGKQKFWQTPEAGWDIGNATPQAQTPVEIALQAIAKWLPLGPIGRLLAERVQVQSEEEKPTAFFPGGIPGGFGYSAINVIPQEIQRLVGLVGGNVYEAVAGMAHLLRHELVHAFVDYYHTWQELVDFDRLAISDRPLTQLKDLGTDWPVELKYLRETVAQDPQHLPTAVVDQMPLAGRLRDLPLLLQDFFSGFLQFHEGGIVPGRAGQTVAAWLEPGERVLTAQQAAASNQFNIPVSITAEGADFDDVVRAAHEAVEAALQGSRARWYRAGASLSGSIG